MGCTLVCGFEGLVLVNGFVVLGVGIRREFVISGICVVAVPCLFGFCCDLILILLLLFLILVIGWCVRFGVWQRIFLVYIVIGCVI